jgi:hypothetical protein
MFILKFNRSPVERRGSFGIWWGSLSKGGHFEDPGLDGNIILEWIFEKWDGSWIGSIWLRIGTGGGRL